MRKRLLQRVFGTRKMIKISSICIRISCLNYRQAPVHCRHHNYIQYHCRRQSIVDDNDVDLYHDVVYRQLDDDDDVVDHRLHFDRANFVDRSLVSQADQQRS